MAPRSFATRLRCIPVSRLAEDKGREVEGGGKIIMPSSVLDKLTRFDEVLDSPMLFKLINTKARMFTNCGVQEFTAAEGHVHLPRWMMENLLIEENDFLRIERTSLPVATYCKFQPLTTDFLDITNPKVVLERALRNFSCLTAGDLIAIRYNDRRYELSVLETKPADAVSIVECDMSVEFAAPVGFKEKQPSPDVHEQEPMDTSESGESRELLRFPGGGLRMDGKVVECSRRDDGKRRRDEPDFEYQISSLRFSRT